MQRIKRRHVDLGTTLEKLDRRGAAEQDPELVALITEAKSRAADCRSLVLAQMTELDAYAQRVDDLTDRLYREALKSRMRPFRDGVHGLPRMVRDVARQLDRQVRLELHGESTEVDRDVLGQVQVLGREAVAEARLQRQRGERREGEQADRALPAAPGAEHISDLLSISSDGGLCF